MKVLVSETMRSLWDELLLPGTLAVILTGYNEEYPSSVPDGAIVRVEFPPDRGLCFVKMTTNQRAVYDNSKILCISVSIPTEFLVPIARMR